MRLVVYTDSVYREAGGTVYGEIAFNAFLGALAEEMGELTVLGRLDPGTGPAHYPLPARVRFVALPHYPDLGRPRLVLRSLLPALRAFWRTLDHADGAWLFGPYLHSLLFAVLALARRRAVILGVRQDMPSYIRERRPATRWMHAAADALEAGWRLLARACAVVVVGPALAREYRHARRLLPIAVSLISSADIAAGEGATERDYDGHLTLLSVGRLETEKNPVLLAEVLALLRAGDPRWRLVVCGDGPLRDVLAARLTELGVDGEAELRGHVPLHNGLLELYRSSHVFLHVSRTEGLPQVLIEAFASGIPVVATAVGGVPAAVDGAALLVAPGDAAAAADAARRVAADGELRRHLVNAGFAQARAHTIDHEVGRIAAFIERE